MQDAGITRQMRLRMFAAAIARVVEDRRRRPRAGERPVVAHVGPKPTRVGLALRQHGYGRIVAMHHKSAAFRVSSSSSRALIDLPVRRRAAA